MTSDQFLRVIAPLGDGPEILARLERLYDNDRDLGQALDDVVVAAGCAFGDTPEEDMAEAERAAWGVVHDAEVAAGVER